MKKSENSNKVAVKLAAINQYVQDNIVKPTERTISGQDFVLWGDSNNYPNYIRDLYMNVSTLKSVIDGVSDYIVGDGVEVSNGLFTEKAIQTLLYDIAFQYALYGGFALNILRNMNKQICKIDVVDLADLRVSIDGDYVYYSKDFSSKTVGRCKTIKYPIFNKDVNHDSSVFIYKGKAKSVYPLCNYTAAIISIEIEKKIGEYHLNSISNGFSSNVIVSFCNGIPTDEIQEEIEDEFNEKFGGSENAGRPMINFCNDKEHSVSIDSVQTDSFADRYQALSKRTQQDIFTAFRANPILFGIYQEGTGFNDQDYEQAFKLFNRTVIRPMQKQILSVLGNFIDQEITIKPFSIDWEE